MSGVTGESEEVNCTNETLSAFIPVITDLPVIRHILEHLGLWQTNPSRDPPMRNTLPDVVYEQYDEGWQGYEKSYILAN